MRKSNQEQSNFSISTQEDQGRDYCEKMNYEIIGIYTDDGYTASNFNRPDWKRMCVDIRKKRPDYVLANRYNRIVRRAGLGLSTVEKLEERYEVTFISYTEMAYIDPQSPVFHKFRGDLFVTADFEWRQGKHESLKGVWTGRKLGRLLNRAPWGYLNERDATNKPIIVIDEPKRPVLELIGHLHHELGLPEAEVRAQAEAAGYDQKGKSALTRVINNPTYYGLIKVPAFMDFPSQIVEGLHEGVWPQSWFYRRQATNELTTVTRKQFEEELELRGIALCPDCDNKLTGGQSKGRSKYYWNYKCNYCNGHNHPAIRKHNQLKTILSSYTFPAAALHQLEKMTREELDKKAERDAAELKRVQQSLENVQAKMEVMEEKFLTSASVAEITYTKWMSRYETEERGLRLRVAELQQKRDDIDLKTIETLSRVGDLYNPYSRMNAPNKQRLLSLLFGKIWMTKKGYRTARIPIIFDQKPLSLKELDSPEAGGFALIPSKSPVGTRNGANIELFSALGELLKTAS